jgi:hypothetical protein
MNSIQDSNAKQGSVKASTLKTNETFINFKNRALVYG